MTAPSSDSNRPRVRLKPKADARAIRHGFPWVYANDLVTDRRTRALTPGTLAVLEDDNRVALGLVAVTPESSIICRMLDRDPDAQLNAAWFKAHLQRALILRETLFDTPFYRLIHAEADGLPGVVIDRFRATLISCSVLFGSGVRNNGRVFLCRTRVQRISRSALNQTATPLSEIIR